MLYYQDDKRYIIQEDLRRGKTKRIGPYADIIPEIKDSFGKDRYAGSIPEPQEQVYDQCSNLREEFMEFTDSKFQNLTLKDVRKDSGLKAKWKCSTCGHEWITTVRCRATLNNGCGYCCKTRISFPEKYIYYYLRQIDLNLKENHKIQGMKNMEFDMYDPVLRLAIEFNSQNNHVNKQDVDKQKFQYATDNNIRLIRIWQLTSVKQVDKLNDDEYIIPAKNSINGVKDLDIIIDDICKQYDLDQSLIDRKQAQDQAFLRTNKNPPEGESLLDQYPDLCRDWDYNKNGVIRPEMLYHSQGIRVHWKCMYCGKEWEVSPNKRTDPNTRQKSGCIQCSHKITKGILQEIPYIPDNKSNKA